MSAHSRLATEQAPDDDAGGTFVWLPEPVVAARGCHHVNDITIDLAAGQLRPINPG